MKEALKVLFSADESATNRAAAFAEILDILLTYVLGLMGIEAEEEA